VFRRTRARDTVRGDSMSTEPEDTISEDEALISEEEGLKQRVTRQSEEAIGKLAQELLESSIVTGALSAAFETRDRAMRAQEAAMGALNLPSASDLERLTRRLRSVSQRLEGIEDALDRLEQRVEGLAASATTADRLASIEAALARIETALPQSGSPGESSPEQSSEPLQ
jgi:chromosome segregation ATPase